MKMNDFEIEAMLSIFIFPVQLMTSRIGNLTRLIHTLLYVMTIHTYIHTYQRFFIFVILTDYDTVITK